MRCFIIFHKVRGVGKLIWLKKKEFLLTFPSILTFWVFRTGLENTTMFYLKYGPVDKNHVPCRVPGMLQVLSKNRHTSEQRFYG